MKYRFELGPGVTARMTEKTTRFVYGCSDDSDGAVQVILTLSGSRS
jgi:hypothetical protein